MQDPRHQGGHDHSQDHSHNHSLDHSHDHSLDHSLDHGHDHSQDHSHDHSHDHSQDHSHDHSQDHSFDHSHDHSLDHSHDHSQDHSHDHSHDHSQDHSHDHSQDHSYDHSHDHSHDHSKYHSRDHKPRKPHKSPEPHDADREAEVKDQHHPHAPSNLRPHVAHRAQADSGSDSSLQQGRKVDFELPAPVSPTRPKSPWARFDPYCHNEDHGKDYVGFATLPNQVHRKSVKKGFDFTLMVAGESGLGKSTLVNSLFLTDLYKDRKLLNAEERITQTVEITKHTVDIEEKGVKLKLTIVDTPGFGDAVNNTECWKSVADYIDQQFEQYFRDESGLNRKNIQDNRVHCCLYFISPFGHGLRPLDVEFMKALHEKVNIVPVLAKADTLTPSEIEKKKIKMREEIELCGIKIYQFPDCDSDEDEEFKQQDLALKESIPFAVIGSNIVVEAKGKKVRGRQYPWGIVEVENAAHCDFVKLRNMLVRTHMQDLKDVTRETHYENYRAQCIQSMTRMSGTDFPIPVVPGAGDSETEKLIREKDEEVRHADHELESHDHTSERGPDRHKHSGAQAEPETHSDHLADEAL
uniref:Septin-type G domain-containing protein n=1 Tax=Scophthalmus maximus TaxID=52904 RepID=A0A8D3B3U6_SCOMX